MLIAGDPSFSYLLSILRMRNHRVVVLGPGGGPGDFDSNSASLASQANLWLDWDTEIMDNIRPVIPRSTATGGNPFPQTTENLYPTSESRESAINEGTSAKMKPLAGMRTDHMAEVNPTVDSLDEQEEAHIQQPANQSTVEEPSSFKLNARATAWQWNPTASTNPTVITPSNKGDTDNLHKPQPQYAASYWEGAFNSTQSTQLTDTAPPKQSEKEYYTWDPSPPPQTTLEPSSSSQTPSRLHGNLPEYFPSGGSGWTQEKASISLDGVAPHFQILIDVLWDFQSQGITSVDRGGTLLNLLQQRDPYILVAAGTAWYKSPFALYLQEAYTAGIISSPTGRVQLAPGYRY
ncbi:hypothetical protein EST38_g1688 [Candolleomyces aberdarensis]|uniref:NYN domain-containing protein n=1 Tax=Candolleomyces aberdarensis TaxID=2316362 RepID=A0A4Q2DWX9_9AGAR|nr:hypothetical protein EST38_g1688 [Candolleomyces aberdarensis]